MKIPSAIPKITDKQVKYIEGLLAQCNITNRIERDKMLFEIFDRKINFLHELTRSEASILIETLKDTREVLREQDGLEANEGDLEF